MNSIKAFIFLLIATSYAVAGNIAGTIAPATKNTDGSNITSVPSYVLTYGSCSGSSGSQVSFTGTSFSVPNVPDGNYCVVVQTQVGTTLSDYTTPAQVTLAATVPTVPVTKDGIAYKMRQAVDGYTFVAIGSVPIGVPCLPDSASGFNLVARSNVTLTSKFDTLPLLVFAKCQ